MVAPIDTDERLASGTNVHRNGHAVRKGESIPPGPDIQREEIPPFHIGDRPAIADDGHPRSGRRLALGVDVDLRQVIRRSSAAEENDERCGREAREMPYHTQSLPIRYRGRFGRFAFRVSGTVHSITLLPAPWPSPSNQPPTVTATLAFAPK